MKFVLRPSLEHMALVKIGISLFNQNDVSALISKLSYSDYLHLNEWMKIEERVRKKVPHLSLPQLLKEKLFGIIKPIGRQIYKWMQYYRKYDLMIEFQSHLDLPAPLPAELCWTPQGTVDRKRTAEVFVKNDNLNVFRRFCLACDYFLEDDIFRFWNCMPENLKDYCWLYSTVVKFWSNNMKGRGAGHISYKEVFYSSVRDNNKVAAKYFLQKLSPQEREESLKVLALYMYDADVLCFLLPELEEEEQITVIKSNPRHVLQCFLQWPLQSFFIGVANYMWDFLSENNYVEILRDIICKIRDGYKDYNYQKLFGEFWQKSPSALKQEIRNRWLLKYLFDIQDKENIQLIIRDASFTAKSKLVYNLEIGYHLTHSIHENEWDFLEFCIQECFPSKSEMLNFKEEFEKCIFFKECSATEKHKWNQLFCSSDRSICEYDKRSIESAESSSSKRFQSLQ